MMRRIRSHLARRDWLSVLLDVVVVIAGILIAFQIDRWAENRRDRVTETHYIERLGEDLELELQRIDDALEFAQDRIRAVRLIEAVVADPSSEAPALPWAIETASWRSFPQITSFVYRELQSTGNLALLGDESLRRQLANHYIQLQHDARVGVDLTIQHEFERQTAGVLTTDELIDVELGSWDNTVSTVSRARQAEIASALAARPEALALLPNLAQHHTFNIKVMESARARTRELIEHIDALGERP